MDRLWKILAPSVLSGRETRKIDLKRELDLLSKPGQAKFAKDVAAIANTLGGVGYLIIGVQDAKERTSTDPNSFILEWSVTDRDAFSRSITQALSNYCNPIPDTRLEEMIHPETGRRLGVIVIPRSFNCPHEIVRESEGVRQGFYVRRGADTYAASREELRALLDGRDVRIVLNFHQPLTSPNHEQLEKATQARVVEIIVPFSGLPIRLSEDRSFVEEARRLADEMQLTPEEWRTLPLVVNLPGLAPLAALLLAELQGRMSRLPTIIRMRPVPNDRTVFEVADVIELQRVRDSAQEWAAGL